MVKNPPANVGDAGLIPGSGRCPGEGNGNPFQCSCLENPIGRGAWQAAVHGVTGAGQDLVPEPSSVSSVCAFAVSLPSEKEVWELFLKAQKDV